MDPEPDHSPYTCDEPHCPECRDYWIDVLADQRYDALRGN